MCVHQSERYRVLLLLLICGLCIGSVSGAPTTGLHLVRYAADGVTVLDERTVDYRWMEANLPVLGDGITHYYHQGPVFSGDPWNPAEDTNVEEKDMGAVKGTNLADLCNLVGGMKEGETVTVRSSDGFSKTFPYATVYGPASRQGSLGITWYHADEGYVPDYRTGMRLVFFADESTNPWGIHAFGVWDMHECLPQDYWYFFQPGIPTTTGLSAQYVSKITISSNEEPTGIVVVESGPDGAAVYLDDEDTGLLTPCTLQAVEIGSHTIRIEKDGYGVPDDRWVTVKAKETTTVHFNLSMQQGSVAVSSVPTGARIFCDGNDTGKITDAVLDPIAIGGHTLLLIKSGYENETVKVEVEADEVASVDVVLRLLNGTGNTTVPRAATPGQTSTPAPVHTATGTAAPPPAGDAGSTGLLDVIVAFFRDLIAFITGSPRADPGQEALPERQAESMATVTVTPTPTSAAEKAVVNRSGGLYVDSFPQSAAITLDNVRSIYSTPQVIYGLREGLHTIKLDYGTGASAESGIEYGNCQAWVHADALMPVCIDGVGNRRVRMISITAPAYTGDAFTVNGEFPAYTLPATVEVEGSNAWITIQSNGTYCSFSIPDTIGDGGAFAAGQSDSGLFSVTVESDPAGAAIFIDGFPTGDRTPALVDKLSAGRHRFVISQPGFLPAVGEITIPSGSTSGSAGLIRSTLVDYPCGSLSVDSTPPGGKIYLYGRYTGETTPHTFPGMRIGTYEVKVVGDEVTRTISGVSITPGTTARCSAVLEET